MAAKTFRAIVIEQFGLSEQASSAEILATLNGALTVSKSSYRTQMAGALELAESATPAQIVASFKAAMALEEGARTAVEPGTAVDADERRELAELINEQMVADP